MEGDARPAFSGFGQEPHTAHQLGQRGGLGQAPGQALEQALERLLAQLVAQQRPQALVGL
jgi:hypothetical protein